MDVVTITIRRESILVLRRLVMEGLLLAVVEVVGVKESSPAAQGMMGSAFRGRREPLEEAVALEPALFRMELFLLLYMAVLRLKIRGMVLVYAV